MPGNGSRPEIKEGDGTEVGDGGGSYLATRPDAQITRAILRSSVVAP